MPEGIGRSGQPSPSPEERPDPGMAPGQQGSSSSCVPRRGKVQCHRPSQPPAQPTQGALLLTASPALAGALTRPQPALPTLPRPPTLPLPSAAAPPQAARRAGCAMVSFIIHGMCAAAATETAAAPAGDGWSQKWTRRAGRTRTRCLPSSRATTTARRGARAGREARRAGALALLLAALARDTRGVLCCWRDLALCGLGCWRLASGTGKRRRMASGRSMLPHRAVARRRPRCPHERWVACEVSPTVRPVTIPPCAPWYSHRTRL